MTVVSRRKRGPVEPGLHRRRNTAIRPPNARRSRTSRHRSRGRLRRRSRGPDLGPRASTQTVRLLHRDRRQGPRAPAQRPRRPAVAGGSGWPERRRRRGVAARHQTQPPPSTLTKDASDRRRRACQEHRQSRRPMVTVTPDTPSSTRRASTSKRDTRESLVPREMQQRARSPVRSSARSIASSVSRTGQAARRGSRSTTGMLPVEELSRIDARYRSRVCPREGTRAARRAPAAALSCGSRARVRCAPESRSSSRCARRVASASTITASLRAGCAS